MSTHGVNPISRSRTGPEHGGDSTMDDVDRGGRQVRGKPAHEGLDVTGTDGAQRPVAKHRVDVEAELLVHGGCGAGPVNLLLAPILANSRNVIRLAEGST